MLQGRKKIVEGKLAEENREIDPLYFHNWTAFSFARLFFPLFIPCFFSLELFVTTCLVFAFCLFIISFVVCGSIPG
jgi:hypothetical protein